MHGGVHPDLLLAWLSGRSLARSLPPPVADHGGWRVDTGTATERRRYVFADPTPGLIALGDSIGSSRVPIKLCADDEVLRACLPTRWHLDPPSFVMTGPPPPSAPLRPGYRIATTGADGRVHVRILDGAGGLAASGYGAVARGVFVYDRIVTDEAHRRRGLARIVMATLAQTAPASVEHILVATLMGRSLYEKLGWRVRSPYASSVIPAD